MFKLFLTPRIAVAGLSTVCWAVLFASLAAGRTTPLAVSRGWLLTFLGAGAVLLLWGILFGLALRATSRSPSRVLWARASASATPLLLALAPLVPAYLSDEAFHFLSANSVPRALALWTPPLLVLAWQTATLAWTAPFPSTRASWLRRRRSPPLLIFAAFATLYLFTAGGHLYSPDESASFFVTESLAERGSIAMPRDEIAIAAGRDPYWYSKYGLVPSLLALPPYWISRLVGLEPDPPSPAFPIPNGAYPLIDLLVNPLAMAAACALLYSLARQLGFRAVTSLAIVLVYGLGTSAWVYSKTFFSQGPGTLFLLATVYLLLRGREPSPRDYGLAGLSLGLAVGSRAELAVLALPLILPIARHLRQDRRTASRALAAFLVLLLASAGATVGWYNYAKTGSILMTGHGQQGTVAGFSSNPFPGLYGSLFSSGFGLFIYNPIAALGICSLPLLALRRRFEAYFFGGLLLMAILFYGSFGDWFAGFTWGNRYLVVFLPFAVLPAAMLLERPWRSPMSLLLFAGMAGISTGVNFLAVLFDFNNGWLDLWERRANVDLVLWDPNYSPIGAHSRLLHQFLYTGAKLDLYIFYKLGAWSLVAFTLVFTGLATLAVRSVLASEGADPSYPATL